MLDEQEKLKLSSDEKCATCESREVNHDAQLCASQSPQKPKRKRPAPVDQLLGSTVEGKYELLQVIGIGGWSKVYKARQGGVDRFVAFKVLHSHLLADTETLARFRQEAQAAGSLQHANITAIHDYGVLEDGRPFIVLDYLEGQTFDKLIKQEGQLPLSKVLNIILQVCAGLKEAHAKSIVHRDLTPANIMLLPAEDGEQVKILDFGLAKVLSPQHESASLTRTGSTVGTPAYMSPEQCRGHRIDARTDIYALGCVIYEALTGKRAVPGDNLLDCMNAHLTLEPEPIAKFRPEISKTPHWQAVVERALQKDPDKRYNDIDEFVHDLLLLAPGKHKAKFIAKPQNALGALSKRFKNKKQTVVVAALSLICLSLAGVIAWRIDTIIHGKSDGANELRVAKEANNASLAKELSQKPNAEIFNLSDCNITDEGLGTVKNASAAHTLILDGTAISDAGLGQISNMTGLKELSLARTGLHGTGLSKLSALPLLRSINLSHTPMVDADLSYFAHVPQLTHLNLSGTTICGTGLIYLASTPNLEELDLSSSALSADGLKRLPALSNLKKLDLHSTIISDQSMPSLLPMSNLEVLNLANTEISDKSGSTLASLKSLRKLDLSNCHITNSICAQLSGLPKLESLNVSNSDVTDEGLMALSKIATLKNLQITGCKVSDGAKAEFLKAHPNCM